MASQKFDAVVATPRTGKFNKNHARRVRVEGKIPAVVYGAGQDAVAVAVDPRVVTKILHSEAGHNTIFDLNVEGAALVKAMIVDWQHEPIKGKLLHIDFKRIAMDKAMRVSVPILLTGTFRVGVKTAGGVLDQIMREVEIECLPCGHSGPPGRGCFRAGDVRRHPYLGPAAPRVRSSSSSEDTELVAHVTEIKEEVVPEEVAAPAVAEPEVAKKGKGDAPAAAGCEGCTCGGYEEGRGRR